MPPTAKQKASSVRHPRALQRDRTNRPLRALADDQRTAQLTEILHPATRHWVSEDQQLGWRERLLTLPVRVALVLSLMWRQFSGVSEWGRVIRTATLRWVAPLQPLRPQARNPRVRTLPAELFLSLLCPLLPVFHPRWQTRQGPVPAVIAWASARYPRLLVCDGSPLEALPRQVGLLRALPTHPRAGRMTALLALAARLPWQLRYEPAPNAHDPRGWPQVRAARPAGALLLFDVGDTIFTGCLRLTHAPVTCLTWAKVNWGYQREPVLQRRDTVRDQLGRRGYGAECQSGRWRAVLSQGGGYRSLPNELDRHRLAVAMAGALDRHRWRSADADALVKRLLGLASFWGGAQPAVERQLWATWLLYAVLVDLTDAVAEALEQPVAQVALERGYRRLYFLTHAYHRGEATEVVG